MSDDARIGSAGRDDDLTRALRAMHAPPRGEGYWDALTARIMERVAAEDEGWWQPFSGWVRVGLVAAGISLLVMGAALSRAREAEARVAFHTIIDTPRSLPQQLATETTGLSGREATLRYLISP